MKDSKTYLDNSLTARNCSRKGYYWVQDILFSSHDEYGTYQIFREAFEKGYKLGKPKDRTLLPPMEGKTVCGFYVPKSLVTERLSNIFNPLLTPSDARENGYVYVDDIIYHILEPNSEIIELLQEHGYKLGIAMKGDGEEEDSYFGLYMPKEANPPGSRR